MCIGRAGWPGGGTGTSRRGARARRTSAVAARGCGRGRRRGRSLFTVHQYNDKCSVPEALRSFASQAFAWQHLSLVVAQQKGEARAVLAGVFEDERGVVEEWVIHCDLLEVGHVHAGRAGDGLLVRGGVVDQQGALWVVALFELLIRLVHLHAHLRRAARLVSP